MALDDPELLGDLVRGALALGIMMLASGVAARLCSDRRSWLVASASLLLVFVWLLVGVVPHPHQAGLLYAMQWGFFGAGLYAAARAYRSEAAGDAEAPDFEALLGFWFGHDLSTPEAVAERSRRWFQADDAFDTELRQRFGDWPGRALTGEFAAWTRSHRGSLALVITLDQLPRNLHRGSAAAFSADERALEEALAAIERGADEALHPLEAAFLYLPLEHAEDAAMQARCVELFDALRARAPEAFGTQLARYRDHAVRHRDVIERFGRFPHRNELLGRETTEEESLWLAEGGDRFGGRAS